SRCTPHAAPSPGSRPGGRDDRLQPAPAWVRAVARQPWIPGGAGGVARRGDSALAFSAMNLELLLFLPVLLFSVVVHEYAHAWMALRQGDNTAYMLGRLTLNPLPHIDLFGSI